MIINSNGKIFGKISIVDVLIIILIIAAIFGAYFRFSNNPSDTKVESASTLGEYEKTDFYYTISIKEIRENNKNHLIEAVGEEFCLNGDTSFPMGNLEAYELEEAKTLVYLTDGSVVSKTIPGKYDVNLTFKINGYENKGGFFTKQLYELCAGRSYSISSLHCSVYGTIENIWK